MPRNIRLLVFVFFCVVAFGQTVETLPVLPQHTKVFFFSPSPSGTNILVGNGDGATSIIRLSTAADDHWVSTPMEIARIPFTKEKSLVSGIIVSSITTSINGVIFNGSTTPTGAIGSTLRASNTTLKITSKTELVCYSSSYDFFAVDGNSKMPLTNFAGVFPSKDGKLYYSGTREGQFNSVFSSGVYTLDSTTNNCSFKEVLETNPNFRILQAWKVTDGFIIERFPWRPQTVETEIVHHSLTGVETVLFSSTTPAKVVTTKCCDLAFDPESGRGVVTYTGSDSRPHLKWIDTLKDVLDETIPGFTAKVAVIKGDYAVLAVGKSSIKFDAVMLVNLKTKESKVFNTGALITGEYIDPRFLTVSGDGTTWIGIFSDVKPDSDRVYKITPTKLLVPQLEPIALVDTGSIVTVVCKECLVTNATTTLLLNRNEIPFTSDGGIIRFTAPAVGQYTLSVQVKTMTQSVVSNSVIMTVTEPIYIRYTERDGPYLTLYDTSNWEPITDSYPVIPGRLVMGFIDYRKGRTLTMTVNDQPMTASFESINENTEKFFVYMLTSPGYASILKVMDGDKLVGEFWFNTLPPQ